MPKKNESLGWYPLRGKEFFAYLVISGKRHYHFAHDGIPFVCTGHQGSRMGPAVIEAGMYELPIGTWRFEEA
jgi:hypothetical protein